MPLPAAFRRHLAARLMGVVGAASLTAAACGSESLDATGGAPTNLDPVGTGGAPKASHASSTTTGGALGIPCAGSFDCPCWQCACGGLATPLAARACVDGHCPSGADACDPACASLDAGVDAYANVVCPDVQGTGGGPAAVQACFVPEAGPCPTNYGVALDDFLNLGCPTGWEPLQIVSGPTTDPTLGCCYMVHNILCGAGGRAYVAGGVSRRAPLLGLVGEPGRGSPNPSGKANGWSEPTFSDVPSLEGLGAAERRALADAWTADALAEHASVPSFARFALALLSLGAPADLVSLAHEAALDEVRHARRCFAIASTYAGASILPGAFPVGEGELPSSFAEIAASTIEEACVDEAIAAVIASERAAAARDGAVRAALTTIAADEARHAELAWRTVAWAVAQGGVGVRVAVAKALRRAVDRALAHALTPPCSTASRDALQAHGHLDAEAYARAVHAAIVEVVLPAAAALLGVPSSDPRAPLASGAPPSELVA